MTRPSAVIEGDLALPVSRPFDNLPPPFGTARRSPPQPPAPSAQSAPPRAFIGLRGLPGLRPGTKHLFIYKPAEPRADSRRFDAAMAEAKSYLEGATVYPRSSRTDYLLGAAIVAGCSIALAWLIVSCSMREASHAPLAVSAKLMSPPVASVVSGPIQAAASGAEALASKAAPADGPSPSVIAAAASASPPAGPSRASVRTPEIVATAPKPLALPDHAVTTLVPTAAERPAVSKPAPTYAERPASPKSPPTYTDPPKANAPEAAALARISEAHIAARSMLNGAARAATRPSLSRQPEWGARAPRPQNDDAIEQAQWRDWRAQLPQVQVATRASTSAVSNADWNDHMIQRRITDDPAAFGSERAGH